MRCYPLFSFWILIALAKICVFHIDINRAKILLYLGAKPEYPVMSRTYAQLQKEAPSLNLYCD